MRVYTDSQYVQKGISEWIHSWKRRGWLTADKKPVKNVDLWKRLDEAARAHHVEWHWVKGHAGHPENERADALANKGIETLASRQIVLDTETTGLNARHGRPRDRDRLHRAAQPQRHRAPVSTRYLNPEREIDEGAAKVHGLTPSSSPTSRNSPTSRRNSSTTSAARN